MQTQRLTSREVFVPSPRREGLSVEWMGRRIVLYDPATGHAHRLDQSAFEVWRQCDGAKTTLDLACRLREIHDDDLETSLDQVEKLLVTFAELDLLESTACS